MLVPCMECCTVVRVIGDAATIAFLVGQNSEFFPDKYPCISCNKPCVAISESDAEPAALARMKQRDLEPEEYFAALNGLGTPDEMVCDAATVRELLSKPVKKVVGRTLPNTQRFLVESIEVEGGTKLYFGAGAAGAVIYRIVRPISYTERALNHE